MDSLTRRVLAVTGRQYLAENDFRNVARRRVGALERRLDGNFTELVSLAGSRACH